MNKLIIVFSLILVSMVGCKEKEKPVAPEVKKVEAITTPALELAWQTDTTSLLTPESVIFDKKMGTYYVACINGVPPDNIDKDGYIARVDQKGKVLNKKWISGLSAPKGMAIKGDTLYVTDINEIAIIKISASKVVNRIKVKDAKFLNDIDVDPNTGIIYFTDTNANKIHSYDGKEVKTLLEGEALGNPNGVFYENGSLMIASFGKGEFFKLDIGNPVMDIKTSGIAGGDGVEKYKDSYLVSNWNGEVYYVHNDWSKHLLLDTKADKVNAADIEFDADHNLLLVPEFFKNRVSAYVVK